VQEIKDANGGSRVRDEFDEPNPFGPTTTFDFQHKVFSIEGGYFSYTADKTQVVYHVPLGVTVGAVPLSALRSTFDIRRGSRDDRLLTTIESSLRFVKVIRPGESIPNELLDGTASWQVSDEHRALARNRILIQLASWSSGNEIVVSDPSKIEQIAEDPITKQRVADAYVKLTEALGLSPDRQVEVEARIAAYIHEVAYIEALRERMNLIRSMVEKSERMRAAYRLDRTLVSEITQMLRLFKTPLSEFQAIFDQVDGQSGEVLALLKNLDSQIAFTRNARDELHHRFLDWDDLIEQWKRGGGERSPGGEGLIKTTYRFLAQRYLTANVWRRS
jgi:hypothetical protein